MNENTPFKLVVAGHVDDGKSTLIGRLLYETDSLPEGKIEELNTLSSKRGMQLEWSFVLDAFQTERNQAITIETTQVHLKIPSGEVVIIDAPGHLEFLKNMICGASNADAALLLVDATHGIREQTHRHAYLLHFLGITQIAVAVNKMDLIDFSEKRFVEISSEMNTYLKEIGITPLVITPISARYGDMLTKRSEKMAWYHGPTILETIDNLMHLKFSNNGPLRFSVQDIYKFDDRRIIAGKMRSGILQVGDKVLFSPSNQTAHIKSIENWPKKHQETTKAPTSIGITLDRSLFVERGDIMSHLQNPPFLTNSFHATLFWVGNRPLEKGHTYKMKLLTRQSHVTIEEIEYEINIENLDRSHSKLISKNNCGSIILRARELIALDEYQRVPDTGRFVLVDGYEIVGGGIISLDGCVDQRQGPGYQNTLESVAHGVTRESRIQRSGHQGGVLWFTGLPGAGKSTLAMRLENYLFHQGYQVYTLDGDNIRHGLNSNLGFSHADRTENIRRIGEVAGLFSDANFICIAAFISPYREDRERVRKLIPAGLFHEIYIKASLEVCEHRDPKGLYKKARKGEILQFTGVSDPYEEPINPELIIDTTIFDIAQCVEDIVKYVIRHFSIDLLQGNK